MMTRQFLAASEDQIRQMIYYLDLYPYNESQLFMYLTWAQSAWTEVTPRVVLENMKATGRSNAGYKKP